MQKLKDKKIILGITGGILAYKAIEFARLLMKEGACVQVIMTENSTRFAAPLTLEAITQQPVLTHFFKDTVDIPHIQNARFADWIVIMPATAFFYCKTCSWFL